MPELTDAQKVMRNDTGKRMADALEALAGTGGRGLPAGGTDGDVLVKSGATDYAARWEKPQYSRANLLDNWYFVGGGSQLGNGVFPINQRGLSTYLNSGYGIDRWWWWDATNYTLNAVGLSLGAGNYIAQKLTQALSTNLTGKIVTMSCLMANNILISSTFVWNSADATALYGDGVDLIAGGAVPGFGMSYPIFIIRAKQATQIIKAVKLEFGSYQTLAHNEGAEDNPNWVLNEIPDWNTERYKCDPTIGSNLATVEPTSTVTQKTQYVQGDYLVYNGKLYKVTASTISQGQTLDPTPGSGNIEVASVFTDKIINSEAITTTHQINAVSSVTIGQVFFFNVDIKLTSDISAWTNFATLTGLKLKSSQYVFGRIGDTMTTFYVGVNGNIQTTMTAQSGKEIRISGSILI